MNRGLGCGESSPGQEGLAHLRPSEGCLSHESTSCLCVLGIRLEHACQKAHPDFRKPPVLLTVKVTVREKIKQKMETSVMGSQIAQVSPRRPAPWTSHRPPAAALGPSDLLP